MERSRQELSIDMITDRSIFKNNQCTPSSCLPVHLTGLGLLRTGVCFSVLVGSKFGGSCGTCPGGALLNRRDFPCVVGSLSGELVECAVLSF